MSLPTILALVDPEHGAATLALAKAAAAKIDATIDAIVIKPDPRDSIPMIGEGMTGDVVEQVMASTEAAGAERAAAARTMFDGASLAAGSQYLEMTGRESVVIAREGRAHAMTVLPCGGAREGDTAAIAAALFDTGRPTLVAPSQAMASVGERVAIFWKDSQEASKAVWSSIPFLRAARQIAVFTVGDDEASKASLERIAAGLTRAGLDVRSELLAPGGGGDSDRLMNAAAAMESDLIVMGAYSHSRLQQLVFGGVTRDMLDGLARPVFMAH